MDKFVSAVKSWVKFERFLTLGGMVSLVLAAFSGREYMVAPLALIYGVSFLILYMRFRLLSSILKSDVKSQSYRIEQICIGLIKSIFDESGNVIPENLGRKKKLSDPV
jgi:hypothetical protein